MHSSVLIINCIEFLNVILWWTFIEHLQYSLNQNHSDFCLRRMDTSELCSDDDENNDVNSLYGV